MASDLRYVDIRRLLESHGWQLDRIHGSHHIFTRPGHLPISIPVHRNRVKAVYAKKIIKIIDSTERAE